MTREASLHVVLYLIDLDASILGFITTSGHTAKVGLFPKRTNFFQEKINFLAVIEIFFDPADPMPSFR